jgi:hypothetical protein
MIIIIIFPTCYFCGASCNVSGIKTLGVEKEYHSCTDNAS